MSSLAANIKQLRLLDRNIKWLSSPIPLLVKFRYYPSMIGSLFGAIVMRRRIILYLEDMLRYDNLATPLTLQLYPYEINHSILSNLPAKEIKTVLDIGGNIGQFSLTLAYALKNKVNIDIFEPNPEAYNLLSQNLANHKNIRTFNVGVGKEGQATFHYARGKSGTGSVFKSNTEHIDKAQQIKINLVDNISNTTGKRSYDLVKIDVEGYEYSLLESIKPLKARYLFIEVSLNRYKNYRHSTLFSLIEKKLGKFDILHLSAADVNTNNFDVLLRFF